MSKSIIPTHIEETVSTLVDLRLVDESIKEKSLQDSDKCCTHSECNCGGLSAIFLMPFAMWCDDWFTDDEMSNDIDVDAVHRAMSFDGLIHSLVLREILMNRLVNQLKCITEPDLDAHLGTFAEGFVHCFVNGMPPKTNPFWGVLRSFNIREQKDIERFMNELLHLSTTYETRLEVFERSADFIAGLVEVHKRSVSMFKYMYFENTTTPFFKNAIGDGFKRSVEDESKVYIDIDIENFVEENIPHDVHVSLLRIATLGINLAQHEKQLLDSKEMEN